MVIQKTALLIIDMQKDVLKKFGINGENVVPRIQETLKRCRGKGMPIIFLARVHRKDGVDVEQFRLQIFKEKPFLVEGSQGADIIDELEPLASEYIINKRRFSGFFKTDLLMLLMRLKVTSLLVCGVQTPNCIRATVTDGIGYDFHMTVLEDATAAQTPEIHQANLLDMHNMGVQIKTVKAFFN
jgi:nicotinamidase-related amidase